MMMIRFLFFARSCADRLCVYFRTQGGCTDCYNARRRMRARQPRMGVASSGTCSAGVTLGGLDAGDVTDTEDDVLHKVHVMLHTRMDTIRVQVILPVHPRELVIDRVAGAIIRHRN